MACIFCSILKGEIPSKKVYEDEFVYAFHDIDPKAPIHIIVIPKEHCANILEVATDSDMMNHIVKAIQVIAKQEGVDAKGFRVVNNCGPDGGQTVEHLHFHLLGARQLTWPPG
ncbi:histidine triad nucleotide-binding protein [Filifactor villosus]|uniref:Histidine triad nucleotide-binding protein n=1 Tax=Filifactor villosus TaxID=29374 RepID=A0ABV9QIY8_9FIRM